MTVSIEWLKQNFPDLLQIQSIEGGGQKWVFKCQHPDLGSCVLKLIKPGASRYLDRELEAVSRLSAFKSANVPQIYEYAEISSQVGNLIWLLEEYVDGIELSDMLSKGPLNQTQLIRLASDLVSIAKNAESVNVVHRDIKPKNIKIDSDGNVWLLDFGIARILDLDSKTRTEAPMGPHTPGYSAPEQFRYQKRQIGGRSDLFAIGVVLHEGAIGKNLFIEGARDRIEILRRVENDHLPKLKLEWDIKGEFGDFVSTITNKFPYQRPSNCQEAFDWFNEIIVEFRGR